MPTNVTTGGSLIRAGACAALIASLWWLHRQDVPHRAYFWGHYGFFNVAVNILGTAVIAATWYVLRSRSRPAALARVALLFGVAVLICGIGEFFTYRGHDYRSTFGTWWHRTWLERSIAFNQPDSELVHRHAGNTAFETRVHGNLAGMGIPDPPRHQVSVRYDRNGFRNDTELTAAEIVVIGDSFVEAALVPADKTLAARLGATLGTTSANLGQAAYGPQQELVVLKRYGLQLEPSLVVWCFFGGNDLQDVTIFEAAMADLDRLHRSPPFVTRSFTRNALLKLARLTTPGSDVTGAGAAVRQARLKRRDGASETVWFAMNTPPWTRHQWSVATDALAQAHRMTRSSGARFVLAYVPRKYTAYRASLQVPPGSDLASWVPTTLPAELASWAETAGIPFVDLTPDLAAEAARGRGTYFPDDTHWNAHGHSVATRSIAARVRALGWRPR